MLRLLYWVEFKRWIYTQYSDQILGYDTIDDTNELTHL